MLKNIKVLKGKVIVEGSFTAQDEELLKTKHKNKKIFEFWRTTLTTLSFLQDLTQLEELSLINTKLADATDLTSIKTIKRLFLNEAKIDSGLKFLSDLTTIVELNLLNFKGPLKLPNLKNLSSLKKFQVWGCKGFSDVSVLQDASQLEEIELVDTGLAPKDLLPLFEKKSIKYISAQFKTKKENDLFSDYLVKFNKKQWRPT